MNDTVVGLLGAIIIVGSMAGVIQALEDSDGTDGDAGTVEGPPPEVGQSTWSVERCQAISLVWTASMAALDDIVGERWTPAEGPVPGQGTFILFGYTCPTSSVDGVNRGPLTGGAALVPVQAPADERNVSAEAWVAMPEAVQEAQSAIFNRLDRHAFPARPGSVQVGTTQQPLGTQVRLSYETSDGRLEASALVSGQTEAIDQDVAVAGTSSDVFSVMHGPESATRQTTGSATVQTSGTTWVEDLGLQQAPFQVAYDTGFAWDFTLEHQPWAGGNATSGAR